MLSRCTQIFTLTVLLSLLAPEADSKPAVIYGNAYGLWSPTHPHVTGGKDKPRSPVLYKPYVPPEPEPEIAEQPLVSDVCPTLQSAPHLCQDL